MRIFALLAIGLLLAQPGFSRTSDSPDSELLARLKQVAGEADSFADRFDAQVWLMAMNERLKPFVDSPEKRLRMLKLIHREAKRAELQPEMVLAVIEVESRFDRYAVSHAGAMGLMQVMPFWKHEIGRPADNLIDLETNLRYGCTILKYYLDISDGRVSDALARYNGSYGEYWYPERVYAAWDRWR